MEQNYQTGIHQFFLILKNEAPNFVKFSDVDFFVKLHF